MLQRTIEKNNQNIRRIVRFLSSQGVVFEGIFCGGRWEETKPGQDPLAVDELLALDCGWVQNHVSVQLEILIYCSIEKVGSSCDVSMLGNMQWRIL